MSRSTTNAIASKTTRRLAAAEGYLELELPSRAIEELNTLDASTLGPLTASYNYLLGEALRMEGRFDEATGPLEQAARNFPAPLRRFAWHSLELCYRELGHDALADFAAMLSQSQDEMVSQLVSDASSALKILRTALESNLEDLLSDDELEELEELLETLPGDDSDTDAE